MANAINKLLEEDLTLKFESNPETNNASMQLETFI